MTNLRDGNINPKEVLKNQINVKPDLGEIIKKRNPNLKSKDQLSVIKIVKYFFNLREEIIEFFKADYYYYYYCHYYFAI